MAGRNRAGSEGIVIYAAVFVVLFIIGGFIGSLSFPNFDGVFYLSGLVFSAFGTGAGILIINVKHR